MTPHHQSAESANHPRREWLGLRQLTEYADISERTIRSWIYSPTDPLPAAKVCGKVLVRKSDFDLYLERHRVRPLNAIDLDAIVSGVLKGVTGGR
ncbi:MAG TPA: helix-turn-helix domain-containing protein [Terriglobia bacterium]|nr:helix-turn-helix domain-containing protein [Terriglobia bacterium]